ncbi:MAG: hypothetical protein NTX02_06870 [Planctomycetia bacterium]|nr:hypothetical protein [Planctomycetia bacterium]
MKLHDDSKTNEELLIRNRSDRKHELNPDARSHVRDPRPANKLHTP